jgi:hypothetical protein
MPQSSRQVARSWLGGAVRGGVIAAMFCVPALPAATVPLQESKSAAVAKELTQALDAAKLENIAAGDPADPNSFVAALYIPGAQLLVVSAKYVSPSLLVGKIANKEYRDVYMDLQSASVAGSKIFVQDLLADGLVARPDGDTPCDVWEQGNKTVLFDRRKTELSEQDYAKAFAEADQQYARMLSLLLAKARPGPGSQF